MIGLDSNILVRLIVGDDPQQMRKAERFLAEHCTSGKPGFINLVVLCELVWTLDRMYHFSRADTAKAISGVLHNAVLRVEAQEQVLIALGRFELQGYDFADALIALMNHAHGCDTTITFDRKAAKLNGFRLLS